MGKKKDKKGKKNKRLSGVEALDVCTWAGDDLREEAEMLRHYALNLRQIPVPATDTVAGGWAPEGVALALARSHMRLSMLITAWMRVGAPGGANADTIRLVRADMRVLAEICASMMNDLMLECKVTGSKQ